jgi:hypothetical protein
MFLLQIWPPGHDSLIDYFPHTYLVPTSSRVDE